MTDIILKLLLCVCVGLINEILMCMCVIECMKSSAAARYICLEKNEKKKKNFRKPRAKYFYKHTKQKNCIVEPFLN